MKTKNKMIFWSLVLTVLFGIVLFAAVLAPYPFDQQNLANPLTPPDASHMLGTDRYGRDLFSRVLIGAQISVSATLLTVFTIILLGTVIGLVSGYLGGAADVVLMRLTDVFLAVPGMVLAIAVSGLLAGGIYQAALALAVTSWPKYARLVRTQTIAIKSAAYIKAAKLNGCSLFMIIFKHILPNLFGVVFLAAIQDIGTIMIELAGLSFLGLGAMPPSPEWGSMISNDRSMIQIAPWLILAPGGAIFVTVSLFHLWGNAVKEYIHDNRH